MEKIKSIAIGGSAADPPHISHLEMLSELIAMEEFDLVIWIISGNRDDKHLGVTPNDRVNMTGLMIPKIWMLKPGSRLEVRYDDAFLENTPTIICLERIQAQYPGAKLTWYTGIDSIVPQRRYGGRCEIEACWERGEELIRRWSFMIFPRRGFKVPKKLPDNFKILDASLPGTASSHIRHLIQTGQPFETLLSPEVAAYVKLNRLYGYQEPEGASQ